MVLREDDEPSKCRGCAPEEQTKSPNSSDTAYAQDWDLPVQGGVGSKSIAPENSLFCSAGLMRPSIPAAGRSPM